MGVEPLPSLYNYGREKETNERRAANDNTACFRNRTGLLWVYDDNLRVFHIADG